MKTIEQRIYDGSRAREVLDNEVFQAVFADIRKDLIESWENIPSTSENTPARDRIHLSLTLLGKVKACIQQSLETGKLAQMDLEHKRTLAERLNPSNWR